MAPSAAPRAGEAARAARRRTILALVDLVPVASQDELAALLRARGFQVTQATVSRDIADLGLVKAARGDRHVYVTPGSLAGAGRGTGAAAGSGASSSAGTGAGSSAGTGAGTGVGVGSGVGAGSGAGGDGHGTYPEATSPASGLREARIASLPHPGSARLRRIVADYPIRIARSGLSLVLISTAGTASVIAQAIDESDLDDQVGTLAGDNTLLVLFADEPALERWRAEFGAIVAQATAGLPGDDLAGTYP